jgi:hypothetical protein
VSIYFKTNIVRNKKADCVAAHFKQIIVIHRLVSTKREAQRLYFVLK